MHSKTPLRRRLDACVTDRRGGQSRPAVAVLAIRAWVVGVLLHLPRTRVLLYVDGHLATMPQRAGSLAVPSER